MHNAHVAAYTHVTGRCCCHRQIIHYLHRFVLHGSKSMLQAATIADAFVCRHLQGLTCIAGTFEVVHGKAESSAGQRSRTKDGPAVPPPSLSQMAQAVKSVWQAWK